MKIDCEEHGRSTDPRFTLHFDPSAVRVEETPFGLRIELPDGHMDSDPGGPALPVVSVEVALPQHTRVRDVEVGTGDAVVLAEHALVAPLQPAAPGVRRCSPFEYLREDGLVRPRPKPPFVAPVRALYEQAQKLAREPVQVSRVDTTGLQPIATVVVRPVHLDARGRPVLHSWIDVTLHLEPDPGDDHPDGVPLTSAAQVERWSELARSRVINPRAIVDIIGNIGRFLIGADYLVITDNQRWDAGSIHPNGALDGDLVAEFERLVAWKRTKGMTARVVTVTDIVNGQYGTFNGSCRRDLQEVLREFVKWAHANWGTAWLLLGGDIDILPARDVVGYVGGFSPGTSDPPDVGGSFWSNTFLKVRANVSADTPLIRSSDGHRIPYDGSGTSSATQTGWYFTDSTYTTRSSMATGNVRVNGPAAQVNTELFWLTNDNTIPSDLYYADVVGYPDRSPNGAWVGIDGARGFPSRLVHLCGGHDWDNVGNGLYGQWNSSQDLDGVRYVADLSVGRAPVSSAAQAKTFVDKVLSYEQQSGRLFSSAWLRKLLLVSSNWGGRSFYWSSPTLANGSYTKLPAANHTVIQLETAPSSFNFKLLSYVTDADQRELPFRLDASPAKRGWYYAVAGNSTAASVILIPLPWSPPITLPLPSRWIVVFGANDEMSPDHFVLDDSAGDGSMLDQEQLRVQLAGDIPAWSSVSRLYEDDVDLPPPAVGAAPLEHLTDARLEAHLDDGPHVVSLSGHGYWGGCCGLNPTMRTSLTNGSHTFIGYADSCLTNEFDVDDAISEQLIQNEHGGAVAYIGNTRFSWIGVGDDFQRNFFKGLPWARALGTLHDRRLAMVGASTGFWPVYSRWTIHSLNLMGDPEMRVWTHRPWYLCLELPATVRVDGRLPVQVLHDDAPLPNAVVSIGQPGSYHRQKRTDRHGMATFDLDGVQRGDLQVTAVHPHAATVRTTIEVKGPRWLEFQVGAVRALPDGATVALRNSDGEREAHVARSQPELLTLLGQASGTGRSVRVLLADDDTIEAVEVGTDTGASSAREAQCEGWVDATHEMQQAIRPPTETTT